VLLDGEMDEQIVLPPAAEGLHERHKERGVATPPRAEPRAGTQ
jgi:hypothetical protein